MTSTREIKTKKTRKKGIRKKEGEYKHTTVGNTIISFYCPSKLADAIDLERGLVSRSVFLVEKLKKELGVELDK